MAIDVPAGRPGFRPVHPGRIVKRNIDALGMTIEAFADHIGTSRQTVHAIIAGRSAVREEMATRLARAFKTTPQFWLSMQANHAVWDIERRLRDVRRIRPLRDVIGGVVRDWRSGGQDATPAAHAGKGMPMSTRKRTASDRPKLPSRPKRKH